MLQRAFDDTREHLLATGTDIILGKGFSAVGLAEILASAGVPKGSFYHYFGSKEGYGIAMLERDFVRYRGWLDSILADSSQNGRAKLEAYFGNWDKQRCSGETRCLVVKLAAEVSDLSEGMRTALTRNIAGIVEWLTACVVLGRADRSIPPGIAADELAAALYQLWLGAALVSKTQRSDAAFRAARSATEQLLGGPAA